MIIFRMVLLAEAIHQGSSYEFLVEDRVFPFGASLGPKLLTISVLNEHSSGVCPSQLLMRPLKRLDELRRSMARRYTEWGDEGNLKVQEQRLIGALLEGAGCCDFAT